MPAGDRHFDERFLVVIPESEVLRDALDRARELAVAAGHDVASPPAPPEEWGDLIARADILVLTPRACFPAACMMRATRLRSIVFPTMGVDPLDVDAATLHGIAIGHGAPSESVDSMAEGTVALIAALMHRLPEKQAVLAAGRWREPLVHGRLLRGKTVGLVGFGRIGRATAALLAPWNARMLFADPAVTASEPWVAAAKVSLTQLLRESDVVSLHVALTPATRNLIGKNELALMKSNAFLVNTSRGGLVDEDALADALEENRLAGAALDTFATEPLPQASRLRRMPNVILTPHNIGHSEELMQALSDSLLANLRSLFDGLPPRDLYNRDVLPRWHQRFGRRGS